MSQQTSQTGSIDTLSFDNARNNSLLLGDHKQVSAIFLKSALTKKLQELFSIAFRKISTKTHSTSTSKFRERHRDCFRSINQSQKKPPREKSQTERHSVSSFYMPEDLMCFSEDVKTVLNEVYKCEKLSQIVESAKRIEEVVGLESRRLEKLKNKERWKDKTKTYDTQLAAVCIQKLLGYVAELSSGSEQILNMKNQIQSLKEKLDQNIKPTRDRQTKTKTDENSINKQNLKAIEVLVTIMRDHKIANIKRKVEQESKKFTELRKELFDGVLSSICKAQVFQQANLSQITQLSSKLLEEQSSIEKNIAHIQKQKRVFEKMLNEAKGEENKIAYYNLIDTSIYLTKLFTNLKQSSGNNNQDAGRARSPPRVRKPISNKTSTKEKPNLNKSKVTQPVQQITVEPFKEQLTVSREQQFLKQELASFSTFINKIKQSVICEKGAINRPQAIQKYDNLELKKIVSSFFDTVEYKNKENEDLKIFIETLSFDIQNMKIKEESLQQIIESRQYYHQEMAQVVEYIKQMLRIESVQLSQIVPKLNQYLYLTTHSFNKSNPQKQYSQNKLVAKLSYFFSSFSTASPSIPNVPQQLTQALPNISFVIDFIQKSIQQKQTANQRYIQQKQITSNLQSQFEHSKQEIRMKMSEISYLKTNIENLSEQVYNLRRELAHSERSNVDIDELRFQISLLKTENADSQFKHQSTIEKLQAVNAQCLTKIEGLQHQLQQQILESSFILQSLKEQHINQKHTLQTHAAKQTQKYKELLNKNTALQSDIFLYKREIDSMKNEQKSEVSQEEVVNSLREQNAILREDVIEKGKMLYEFEVGQLSPRSMKSNASESLHNILEAEEAFKKKNTSSSSDMLKDFKPYNQQINRSIEDKAPVEVNSRQLNSKLEEISTQKAKDDKTISQLKREIKLQEVQINSKHTETERLKKQIEELKRSEAKLQERLKEYEIEEGSMIMKNTQKWNNQQSYLDSLDSHTHNNASRGNLREDSSLLRRIDYLQGQLYNQGSKLIKSNAMREQDLKVLMSENHLLQQQVKQINHKLAADRIKLTISSKSLEDSMRKMQFQLNKLRHEGTLLKEELRNAGNFETSGLNETQMTPHVPKPKKSSYQFVTRKFSNSNTKTQPKLTSLPTSPKTNKFENHLKQMEKQKQSLVSRVRLLSVFTIIDEQNKAFVHNINKIISSLLDFLSISEQFEQCDYTDVDYVTTLTEYLHQEDYEGYFETLETFFKDLFLNVFERKNAEMLKQTDQLMFLRDKMEVMLSEKIDEIEEEEEKLNYNQRTPLRNYNEEKCDASSHLQHLFKMYLKNKDPKILREVCLALNFNEERESY